MRNYLHPFDTAPSLASHIGWPWWLLARGTWPCRSIAPPVGMLQAGMPYSAEPAETCLVRMAGRSPTTNAVLFTPHSPSVTGVIRRFWRRCLGAIGERRLRVAMESRL